MARGLDRPWSLLILPDGEILVRFDFDCRIHRLQPRRGPLGPEGADG
jgi:hypothetical protein